MSAPGTHDKGKTLRAPAALADTPLGLFAPVYAACAARGISALEVDEMEPWQVASTLQLDMGSDDTPSSPGTSTSAGPPPPGALSRGRRRPEPVGGGDE